MPTCGAPLSPALNPRGRRRLLERYTLSKEDKEDLLRRVAEDRAQRQRERSMVDENAEAAWHMTREQRLARCVGKQNGDRA